jgi:hypothetical protein
LYIPPVASVAGREAAERRLLRFWGPDPQKNPSRAILPHIDFIKQIRAGALHAAQFHATLTDAHGTFTKPATW